eukprot:c5473_g1_i1 orf=498-1565(-)
MYEDSAVVFSANTHTHTHSHIHTGYSALFVHMEEEALKEAWAWLDEDFRLDTNSPLATSRSLWEDFTSTEAVVRSLFPSTPAPHAVTPAFSLEQPESPERSSSWDITPDCSPSPLKRRCMLQFCDEDLLDITPCASGPLESDSDYLAGACENSQVNEPSSSNSLWYIATEESLSSVDTVERSAESWMVGCLSDSDTSDVQEIPPPYSVGSLVNVAAFKTSLASATGAVSNGRPHKTLPPKVACPLSHSKQAKDIPGKLQPKRQAHVKPNRTAHVKETTRPALAYPFALVKPSGIQGDVTLQDINQRIKSVLSAPRCGAEDPCKSLASPLSGKSVLALTKIQTEGKGTITILRTRN